MSGMEPVEKHGSLSNKLGESAEIAQRIGNYSVPFASSSLAIQPATARPGDDSEQRGDTGNFNEKLKQVSTLPPDKAWEDDALRWASQHEIDISGSESIIHYVVTALSTNVFRSDRWIEALAGETEASPRLKNVLIKWGCADFEVR